MRDPQLIRDAMAERGDLSLRELAKLAECTDGMISFILTGRQTSPRIARAIARSLRRPVGDLFVDAETTSVGSSDQQKKSA